MNPFLHRRELCSASEIFQDVEQIKLKYPDIEVKHQGPTYDEDDYDAAVHDLLNACFNCTGAELDRNLFDELYPFNVFFIYYDIHNAICIVHDSLSRSATIFNNVDLDLGTGDRYPNVIIAVMKYIHYVNTYKSKSICVDHGPDLIYDSLYVIAEYLEYKYYILSIPHIYNAYSAYNLNMLVDDMKNSVNRNIYTNALYTL